jgi:hypothetical protein
VEICFSSLKKRICQTATIFSSIWRSCAWLHLLFYNHKYSLSFTNYKSWVKLTFLNRKSTNSSAHSAIANSQLSFVCQISADFYKCCTTLPQNSPKSPLFTRFFNVQIRIRALRAPFAMRKSMYSNCGLADVFSPQILTKIGSASRKSENCHIGGRSANLTNCSSPQICGFVI